MRKPKSLINREKDIPKRMEVLSLWLHKCQLLQPYAK